MALHGGTVVKIKGIQKRPELNDKLGLLRTLHTEKARWQVTIVDSGENVLLKPENLEMDDALFSLIINDEKLLEMDESHVFATAVKDKVKKVIVDEPRKLPEDIYEFLTKFKPPKHGEEDSLQRRVLFLRFNAFGHHLVLDVVKVGQNKLMGRIFQSYLKLNQLVAGIPVPTHGFTAREWLGRPNFKWMSHNELKNFAVNLQKLRAAITNLVEDHLLDCAEQFVPYGTLYEKRMWASRTKTSGCTPFTGLTMQPGDLESVDGYSMTLDGTGLPKHASIYHGIYSGNPVQVMDFPLSTLKEIMTFSTNAFSVPNPVMAFTFLAALEWHTTVDAWSYIEAEKI